MPPFEGLLDPLYCTATLLTLPALKYCHAYSHCHNMYSTAICADPYHSLTHYPMIELLLILLIAVLAVKICRDAL